MDKRKNNTFVAESDQPARLKRLDYTIGTARDLLAHASSLHLRLDSVTDRLNPNAAPAAGKEGETIEPYDPISLTDDLLRRISVELIRIEELTSRLEEV